MSIQCGTNGSCPLLYQCTDNLLCKHQNVFPITPYEYAIFSIFPICSAICNLSGNSFGQFKVLMLMDLLNYQENEATTYAYPLITGTALFNFFDLIFKRHPTKNTSLIDYNIVLIIIPNILFGSTIGSLVNKFIPPIVADSIIIPMMIGFSIKFFLRYKNLKKQQRELEKLKDPEQKATEFDKSQSQRESYSRSTKLNKNEIHFELIDKNQTNQLEIISKTPANQIVTAQPLTEKEKQLQALLMYESGYHILHVLATIGIFLVFQTLSFLAQGKIVYFSICSSIYPIGMSILAVIFLAFDFTMYIYTKKRVNFYKQIGYKYEPKIDVPKYYIMICFGVFFGGFNSGVFGIGNSTTVIFTLLFLDLEPAIVSATVGYQVVFAGSASLIQASATGSISSDVALLFFLETFIIGGILSFLAKRFVSNFNQMKVNLTLLLIVFSLVTTSVFALIASIVLGYLQFGSANMQDVPFHCP